MGTIIADLLQKLSDVRHQGIGWEEVSSQKAEELPAMLTTVPGTKSKNCDRL